MDALLPHTFNSIMNQFVFLLTIDTTGDQFLGYIRAQSGSHVREKLVKDYGLMPGYYRLEIQGITGPFTCLKIK